MSPLRFILIVCICHCTALGFGAERRPNVFIAISDDQSWPHASAYGSKMVDTPAFDRIAREGVLFTQAFCPSPGCSPSRAALLTGRHTWQLEHAGTHGSYFHAKYETFPDRLEQAGYAVASTGKGWGPGDFAHLGRAHNPAGRQIKPPKKANGRPDYAAAFRQFFYERRPTQPFCFWFGSSDAHRSYEFGSGQRAGKRLTSAEVPPFLPDAPEVRSDLLDYAWEVERFDRDVASMLELLEAAGELDNTLVIVTSDNGMPFPRAKANCYEYGIHMPLAVRWGDRAPPGRNVNDLISFVDLTATIYEATGVAAPALYPPVGRSLVPLLTSPSQGIVEPERNAVYAARERHSSSRYNSLGYPQRAIRTHDYLYIRNFKPERLPAGPAEKFAQVVYNQHGEILRSTRADSAEGYHDIDASPTLSYLIANQSKPRVRQFLDLAVAHRPAEELFDVKADPGCLRNLADASEHADVRARLKRQLLDYLQRTGDPRVTSNGDVWETYPRVSKLRWFPKPDWAEQNPELVPPQPWLEVRRPKP